MKIELCFGKHCLNENRLLAEALRKQGVMFLLRECRSLCTYAPIVFVDGKARLKATLDDIEQALRK